MNLLGVESVDEPKEERDVGSVPGCVRVAWPDTDLEQVVDSRKQVAGFRVKLGRFPRRDVRVSLSNRPDHRPTQHDRIGARVDDKAIGLLTRGS